MALLYYYHYHLYIMYQHWQYHYNYIMKRGRSIPNETTWREFIRLILFYSRAISSIIFLLFCVCVAEWKEHVRIWSDSANLVENSQRPSSTSIHIFGQKYTEIVCMCINTHRPPCLPPPRPHPLILNRPHLHHHHHPSPPVPSTEFASHPSSHNR